MFMRKNNKAFTQYNLAGNKVVKLFGCPTYKSGAGFTLLEIIIVTAVVSLLAAFVWVGVNPAKKIGDAKDARRYAEADSIKQAVLNYIQDYQALPAALGNLATSTPFRIRPDGESDPGYVSCNNILGNVSTTELSLVPDYLPTLPIGPDGGFYYLNRNNKEIIVKPCNTYGQENINNGLVSVWHLDETTWDGSTNEIRDEYGLHHGSRIDGAAVTTSTQKVVGSAAGHIETAGNRLTILGSSDLNTSSFSLAYWFRNHTEQSSGAVPRITAKTNGNFDTAIANTYTPANEKRIYYYNGSNYFDTGYDAEPGEWHHYAWAYDGVILKFYLDGVEKYSDTVAIAFAPTDDFFIFNQASVATVGAFGTIDEVAWWSRALTVDEALYLYNLQKPR